MAIVSIAEAADLLSHGKLVAFPTETVYGLGANALNAVAVAEIYDLKERPPTSPVIVHVSSLRLAQTLVTEWPDEAEKLAHVYWPGPLTLVLPKRDIVPDMVTSALLSVGIRMPNHPLALELIDRAGLPLAAPSANRFMQLSPTTAEHVRAAFGDDLPIIDGGPCRIGIESTVVRIADGQVTLLRPGGISREQLEKTLCQPVQIQDKPPEEAHPAPGMHARHYSPRTPLFLVKDPPEIPIGLGAYVYYEKPSSSGARMPSNPTEYAAKLYQVLHDLDRKNLDWIAVEAPPNTPEWAAVNDRLRRAASLIA